MMVCPDCKTQNDVRYSYCKQCGTRLSKGKTRGFSERLRDKTRSTIDALKLRLNTTISGYLDKFDEPGKAKIAGFTVPERERETIRNALLSFQKRVDEKNHGDVDLEFQEWLRVLPERLQEEKCIICFGSWLNSEDNIVVCKHCNNGGHQNHLVSWLKTNDICPLCRKQLSYSELILIQTDRS